MTHAEETSQETANSHGRVPPHDNEAEMSVLGAMMLSPRAVEDAGSLLRGQDFYRPTHETIFDAIIRIDDRNEPVDAVTVAGELTRVGDLERVGGAPYIHTLTASVPVAANAEYYAVQVASKATFRRIAECGTRIAEMGYSGTGDADAVADEVRAIADAVTSTVDATSGVDLSEILPEIFDEMQNGREPGLTTGWSDLDKKLGGLEGGRLAVVAAGPAVGKSLMLTNIATHVARHHNVSVLFASLEMSPAELTRRIVSAVATVKLASVSKGALSDEEWNKVSKVYPGLNDTRIRFTDSADQTPGSIRRAARDLVRDAQRGKCPPLGLIVIDYLQLMAPSSKHANKAGEVSEISRSLKLLAMEFGVPVLAASQFNREGLTSVRPATYHLKESSSIETDADQIILMSMSSAHDYEIDVNIAKNRNGSTALLTLLRQGHYARLAQAARD